MEARSLQREGVVIQATFTRSLDCLNLETFLDPVPFFIAFTRSHVKKKFRPHGKAGAERSGLIYCKDFMGHVHKVTED